VYGARRNGCAWAVRCVLTGREWVVKDALKTVLRFVIWYNGEEGSRPTGCRANGENMGDELVGALTLDETSGTTGTDGTGGTREKVASCGLRVVGKL